MTSYGERRSSSDVAYEAEDVRAGLARTLDQLRHNLRPENVVEEVVSNARIGASTLADSLSDVARQNPLPALLIGAGCALFLGLGTRQAIRSRHVVDHEPPSDPGPLPGGATFPRMTDNSPSAGRTDTGLEVEYRSEGFEDGPGRLRPYHPDADAPLDGRAGFFRRRSPRHVASRLPGVVQEQPLILAALGIAAGAALGAALPSTRTEDEWMGPSSASLRHAAQDAARSELDELRGVAHRTVDNLKQTAADHGLSSDNINGLVRDVGGHATSAIGEVGHSLGPDRA